MFFLNSLNLLLDGQRNDDRRSHNGAEGASEFPNGQLSSAAWEGWWQDDAA
jgi:hypothetical protein